jgi:3-oxoacyl-[acyl-carrier-protein] synthase-1
MGHEVSLEQPWRGLPKLAIMAAMAIDEALQSRRWQAWADVPLVLCVAEKDRPGRFDGLDNALMQMIGAELGVRFSGNSTLVAHGRVGTTIALRFAMRLISEGKAETVLVAATDSLLSGPTLDHYDLEGRLLGERNSNGFIPGEGAGALLVGRLSDLSVQRSSVLACRGLGFATETVTIASDEPLRADGLTQAIKAALSEAGLAMHDLDFRITDISGEHYYFKEAALALQRTLKERKEEFDLWHPAECTGEQGAASGPSILALAYTAAFKGYAKGSRVLTNWANDSGQRSAAAFEFRRGRDAEGC